VDTSRGSARGSTGRIGEDAALTRYRELGFRLLARNWRCPLGEIDLIVARGGVLVFCEGKTRLGAGFGGGYEAVTWKKQRKLRQLAELFLVTQAADPVRVRFDVASVFVPQNGPTNVELFEDAF
jgi:putative endonuclease